MFDPQQKIHEINRMDHGSARLEAAAQAVRDADDAGLHYWRLYFRYQYIKESTMYGDNFKGLLCFPEYLKIFDEHPELEDDMYHDMMWAFKWVIGNLDDYYQISLEETEHYFEEFKKRSQKYGFSLRTYYMQKVNFWLYLNPELAADDFVRYQKYPRSPNSDCEACELNFQMKVLLSQNQEEKALEIIQPVLRHEKDCAEIPHVTYYHLAAYYFRKKNFSEAAYYAALCERMTGNKPEFLREIGGLLEIYSCLDIGRGWNILKYNAANFANCRNPMMKLRFAQGAYRLFQEISRTIETVSSQPLCALPVELPGTEWSTHELAQFFYQQASEIARKLDQCNQKEYYLPLLNQPLPECSPEAVVLETAHSVHGIVKKEQTALLLLLKQNLSPDELEQRIQKSEKISCYRDKNSCYVSFQAENILLDLILKADSEMPPTEHFTIQGMTPDALRDLLDSPGRCLIVSELSGLPQKSFYAVIQYLSGIFPEMNGFVNLTAQKAFPAEWVRFAVRYENAIAPEDLYSVYFARDPEKNEIWGTTIGLCAWGLRELELIGANTENFELFAGILDQTAAFCIERNSLPDENECIIPCRNAAGKESEICWQQPETALKAISPESFAVSVKRAVPSGILNLLDLPDLQTTVLPVSRSDRRRIARLAEETFPVLVKAMEKTAEKAVVQLALPCEDNDEYDFELLWAEPLPGGQKAVLIEESELLPQYHEGDEVKIVPEAVFDWRIQRTDTESWISPQKAYLLQEDAS